MVCSSNDLVAWRDFPKGLRVLLLVEDGPSAVETKLMLEEMNYVVSSFYNGKDAFEVISAKHENFHVAVVEVTTMNSDGSFRFLEMAKDLPTVVISNIHCLSTMMKCIALGAVEFLQNPVSEDKLKNIWQHVVHKAFNAGGDVLSKSLKPVKESVVSMLQLQSETGELEIEVPTEMETSERFSAPSTPQLKQGVRLVVGEEQPKEKEVTTNTTELISNCSDSKSVDNTCNNLIINVVCNPVANEVAGGEEVDSSGGFKTGEWSNVNSNSQKGEDPKKKKSNLSVNSNSHGHKRSRKSTKVDWTSELHRKFVQAVEQLGIDQAIPSKILELMKVEGLTRHNVASHLQKFRMNRRHILPKDDGNKWRSHRDPMSTCYASKPLVAFPPIQRNYDLPPNLPYRIWGHPSYPPPGLPLWGNSGYPPWHPPPDHLLWNTHQRINADAWGCPIAPPYSQWSLSQAPPMSNYSDAVQDESRTHDTNWVEKVIDEAVNKPWLPLPLGLKPPSVDGVLAELHRKGLRTVPPSNSTSAIAAATAAGKKS